MWCSLSFHLLFSLFSLHYRFYSFLGVSFHFFWILVLLILAFPFFHIFPLVFFRYFQSFFSLCLISNLCSRFFQVFLFRIYFFLFWFIAWSLVCLLGVSLWCLLTYLALLSSFPFYLFRIVFGFFSCSFLNHFSCHIAPGPSFWAALSLSPASLVTN